MKATMTTLEKMINQEIKMYDKYCNQLKELEFMLDAGYYPEANIKNAEELVDIYKQQWLGARKLIQSIHTTKKIETAEKSVLMKKGAGMLP